MGTEKHVPAPEALPPSRRAAATPQCRPPRRACRELQHQLPRMKMGNYTLNGIVGFELSRKTYGVVGTGNIGIEASAAPVGAWRAACAACA